MSDSVLGVMSSLLHLTLPGPRQLHLANVSLLHANVKSSSIMTGANATLAC